MMRHHHDTAAARGVLSRRRAAGRLGVLMVALGLGACGDPIVVLGDNPGFMRVVAGIPDSLGVRIDTLALRTRFTDPSAVGFDETRSLLYVIDRGALRQQGGIIQRVARIMSVDSRGRLRLLVDAGGCAGGTCLHAAAQMVPAPDGSFLLADPVGNRVLRFNPTTFGLSVVAGTGVDAFTPDGAPAAGAALRSPAGVAIGTDGTIYIAEYGSARIRYIDAAGTLRTLAGTGTPGYAGDGGPAGAAQLSLPTALAAGDATLYLADVGSHTVRSIDLANGIIETVAGTGGPGFSGDGGPAFLAQLFGPTGLTLSADEASLFISDRDNHRVRRVDLAGATIETFAGTGSAVFAGARGPAGDLSLRWPSGLALTPLGFLYIADTGHYIVWRATLTL